MHQFPNPGHTQGGPIPTWSLCVTQDKFTQQLERVGRGQTSHPGLGQPRVQGEESPTPQRGLVMLKNPWYLPQISTQNTVFSGGKYQNCRLPVEHWEVPHTANVTRSLPCVTRSCLCK